MRLHVNPFLPGHWNCCNTVPLQNVWVAHRQGKTGGPAITSNTKKLLHEASVPFLPMHHPHILQWDRIAAILVAREERVYVQSHLCRVIARVYTRSDCYNFVWQILEGESNAWFESVWKVSAFNQSISWKMLESIDWNCSKSGYHPNTGITLIQCPPVARPISVEVIAIPQNFWSEFNFFL